MAAQIGNDRIGPFCSNVLGESLWSHAGQRGQIRKPLAKSGIGFPQAFPFLHGGVRKGEMPGIEGKRPTIVARQRRETLHRGAVDALRSEEHTSELQSLMRISYAVFCLKKKKNK